MSDFAAKNYGGLMEAYASIYKQPEQVIEEQVNQEVYFEDVEVDNDLLVDVIANLLVAEGYAKTEDQALNMIPHMSDAWLDTVVGNFVLEQNFIECVNSIIEEGYDLSSYTIDELYEEYVGHFNNCLNEDYHIDLHEAIPLLAAPLLANPATWAAGAGLAAGIGYAGKKVYDALRQRATGTDAASQRWLNTGSYATTKQTPSQQRDAAEQRKKQRLQQGRERLTQRQQQPTTPAQPTKPTTPAQPTKPTTPAQPTTPAAGGAPPTPPSGGGGKPPKIDPLQTVKSIFKAGKEFIGKGKGPLSQVLGKPARERFFGTTKAGQITRGATAAGVSALDIGGKIADPSKPSLVSKLGSVGPGAVGTTLQATGNIPGIRGTSLGTGARGTGGAFRQVGREMRDQGLKPPSTPSTNTDVERKRIENLFK